MLKRALLCFLAGAILTACGPDPAKPVTESEICGPGGCDGCIGTACQRLPDGGVP